MKILAVIPARKNSQGIPKKNIRILAGKPMITYGIETAGKSRYDMDIAVSTDDEEVKLICRGFNEVYVVNRPIELSGSQVTLDAVVYHTVMQMEKENGIEYDTVITLQPTSPLLTAETLDSAIDFFYRNRYHTLISAINKPHLAWKYSSGKYIPAYEKRKNRQELPKYFIETGAFLITKREFVSNSDRIGPNIMIYEMPLTEAVDIDDYDDFRVAENRLRGKRILIRVDGYDAIGLGHIYRCLTLAYALTGCEVRFVLSKLSGLGKEMIKKSYFPYNVIDEASGIYKLIDKYQIDIVINDILDTEDSYIKLLKRSGVRIVNFEDLGSGAQYADVVINDMYKQKNCKGNFFWGHDYYCMRSQFYYAHPKNYQDKVEHILVTFGGTDPSHIMLRIFDILKRCLKNLDIRITFLVGLGNRDFDDRDFLDIPANIEIINDAKVISQYMELSDMAISSQGRTMLELASMQVPTILLAQNERELDHEFGTLGNGFINLGLCEEADDRTIEDTIMWLMNCSQYRKMLKMQMEKTAPVLKEGIERVKRLILE